MSIALLSMSGGAEMQAHAGVEPDTARLSRSKLYLPDVHELPARVGEKYGCGIAEVRGAFSIPLQGELVRDVVIVEGQLGSPTQYPLRIAGIWEDPMLNRICGEYVGDYVSFRRGEKDGIVTTAFRANYPAEMTAELLGGNVDIPLSVFYGSFPKPSNSGESNVPRGQMV